MRGFTEDEMKALATIDQCEWFFWTMHERCTKEEFAENQRIYKESAQTLKNNFNYDDDLIRDSIKEMKAIAQTILERNK